MFRTSLIASCLVIPCFCIACGSTDHAIGDVRAGGGEANGEAGGSAGEGNSGPGRSDAAGAPADDGNGGATSITGRAGASNHAGAGNREEGTGGVEAGGVEAGGVEDGTGGTTGSGVAGAAGATPAGGSAGEAGHGPLGGAAGAAGTPNLGPPGAERWWVLEVTPEYEDYAGIETPAAWLITADVREVDGAVEAWFAGSGRRARSGDVVRDTQGSAQVSGSFVGETYTFDSLHLKNTDQTDFEGLVLSVADDGSINGRVAGSWELIQGDERFYSAFTAAIAGSADDEAPGGRAIDISGPILPFQPIEAVFSEPIQVPESASLTATTEGGALPLEVTFLDDERAGFVTGVVVSTPGWWPTDAQVELRIDGITDAAGNVGSAELGTATITATPDSAENPDFEAGLDGWLPDPGTGHIVETTQWHSTDVSAEGDPTVTILAPQGSTMAYVSGGIRLVGWFIPPLGATELCLTVGVLECDVDGGGLDIDLIQPELVTNRHFGHDDLQPFAYPEYTWSGFHELCMGLPEGEPSAFWMVITPTGRRPPVFFNDLLVDDVFFVVP